MNPFVKLGGILVLLVIGFKVTLAVLPRDWTGPKDAIGTFGFLVGCLGATLITFVVLIVLKALFGSPSKPADR